MKNLKLFLCLMLISTYSFSQIPTLGLKAHFKFNYNLIDSSGNNVSVTNAPGTTHGGDRANKVNNSLYFTGTNSYAQLNNLFDYKQKTVSLWLRPSTNTNSQMLVVADRSSLVNGLFYLTLIENTTGQMRFATGNVSDTIQLGSDVWNHVVVTLDTMKYKIYLNGKLKKSGVKTANITSASGINGTVLGSDRIASGSFYRGNMDDFRVYNRVLNNSEISQLAAENGVPFDTTFVTSYDTIRTNIIDTTYSIIYDTVITNIIDTNYVSVVDTLFIKAQISNIVNPIFADIKVYPNPTSSDIFIEVNDLALLQGSTFKLIAMNGATVYNGNFNQLKSTISLSSLMGYGTYQLLILNAQQQVVSNKKIVLVK